MQRYSGCIAVQEAAKTPVVDQAASRRLGRTDGRVKGLELLNPPHQPAEPAGAAPSILPQVKSLQLKPLRAKTPKFHGPHVSGARRRRH